MEKSKILEICCGSYEDALTAYKCGAQRIELNSALHLGGLTPSLASLQLTKKNTNLKVICMVRPRGGGFCYSDEDFEVMKTDGELLMQNGADGLAFGFLTIQSDHKNNKHNGTKIDLERTKTLIEICHNYNGEAVFHRAFDCVADPFAATEELISLGAQRILTSGQEKNAWDGRDLIATLQKKYGSKIEFLAGSGIDETNALELLKATGIYQLHSSCKAWNSDFTSKNNSISFDYNPLLHANEYEIVSAIKIKKILKFF